MSVNAIDFSDLTGVKVKPKQTNAQGFYSPDKVPEKKKEAHPASMGYPTQKTPAGD